MEAGKYYLVKSYSKPSLSPWRFVAKCVSKERRQKGSKPFNEYQLIILASDVHLDYCEDYLIVTDVRKDYKKILEKAAKEIPVKDLPLYMTWPFRSSHYMKIFKDGDPNER